MSQLDLFSKGGHAQPVSEEVDPAEVRRELLAMLEQARAAAVMPWPEERARINEVIFPQMANWLPETEAAELRAAFAAEIERLKRAAAA